ncbi:DMT family transporter [Siphonobacter sp.]|uniref:DMT family transporter n=1 Tax=Siphonobacter sp. TaxID=1869184 RepID=UPI003B3B5F94
MKNSFWGTGLLFAALWSSASVAAKFGLQSAEPMLLFDIRYFGAGILLLTYALGVEKQRLPQGKEWLQIATFGLLNTVVYLSLFVFAMKQVAAGIGSLAIALNPLLISVLSAFWTGQKVASKQWTAIALGMAGVALATYPLLQNSFATPQGLLLLFLSMLSYSVATIYFSGIDWKLSRSSINGWQTLMAGLICLPLVFVFHEKPNLFDTRFWASEVWLTIFVSVLAVQLWLKLLHTDAVRASLFLFLCPVFGFAYATFLLGEPFSWYTGLGTVLVLVGLWMGQKK